MSRRPRVRPYGDRALLVDDVPDAAGLAALLAARRGLPGQDLRAPAGGRPPGQDLPAVQDVVPGAATLLLRLERPLPLVELARVAQQVADSVAELAAEPAGRVPDPLGAPADPGAGPAAPNRPAPVEPAVVEVPVVYDGEDLAEVAELTGLPVADVVARHAAADYVVALAGFTPGFAYLRGLDPLLHVPRRADPRAAVPAGAVAVAGEWTGVYPRESPGGWRLLGRTDLSMWDLDRDPPALLRPGTRVRFRPAGP